MKKTLLAEVTILRPVAILLLVVMHSFTVYNGSWRPFEGFESVEAYKWITRVTFSFMLELFVFISGYVLAFQIIEKGRNYAFLTFAKKKAMRLLLPSVLFSTIYLYWLYPSVPASVFLQVKMIVEGVGHLWFLPMLFWCFILGLLLIKTDAVSDKIKLVVLIVLAVVSAKLGFLPLRIGTACYYLLFFYVGYITYKYKDKLMEKTNWCHVLLLFTLFLVSFLFTQVYLESITAFGYTRIILLILAQVGKVIYASSGMMAAYLFVMLRIGIHHTAEITPPHWLMWLNSVSFGIYIFQQFILQFLYYHTSLPQFTGVLWLPWVGCCITIVLSALLAGISIKTKIGRFLIG